MADRVYLHIGLPKTATTYLQRVLWGNRAVLEEQGLRLPGAARNEHYWATRVVREDPAFLKFSAFRRAAWERLCDDAAAWPGTAVISHEFFAAASADQAARAIERLAPAEVHVVVTAREPVSLFAASWQESLKNRSVRRMDDYGVGDGLEDQIWAWRTLDVRLVLERWAATLPPGQVHVLPLPGSDRPRREIWDRFAGVVGVDADSVELGGTFPNESMGVVEAETLRRINLHLEDFSSAIERGTYIRTYLADERLVPRRGERFWPSATRIAECRERGERAVAFIAEQGYDVVGDLDSLRVPAELPPRREPISVTDGEVAGVATELVARMLADVRDLRHERKELRAEIDVWRQRAENPGLRPAIAVRWPRLRRWVFKGHPWE